MTFLALFLAYAIGLSIALGRAGYRSREDPSDRAPTEPPRHPEHPPRRPERFLIVGATGGTGRELVAQALERGYEVTALARTPSRLDMEHARLAVVRGDVLEPGSLDTATRGQDAVLSALGHKQWFRPTRILSEGTRNLLRAMDANGVSRLVCETSLGIGDSAGRMGLYYTFLVIPVILPFYYWDKTRQERAIAESGAEWVIVRPGALTHGPARGAFRHGHHIGSFVRTVRISRADVARFMLDQLEGDAYARTAVGVAW